MNPRGLTDVMCNFGSGGRVTSVAAHVVIMYCITSAIEIKKNWN